MTDFATLLYTSTRDSLPFYMPKAWNRYPYRAEPPRKGHYREYPRGPTASFSRTLFKRAIWRSNLEEQFGGAIWKRQLLDGRNWRNLENGWHHDNHVISLTEICSNSNPKWPLIIALSNSSGVRWTKKGLGPKNHELNVLITPFKPWVSVGLLRGDVIGIPSLRARNTRGQKTCLCGFSLALVWMWKKATVKP